MFPRLLEVFDPARCVYALPEWRARCCLPRVRSASAPRLAISGLHTLPARSPVNASRTPLPRLAHDSGPAWLARPSLSETCTPSHRAGLSRHTRTGAVNRRPYVPLPTREKAAHGAVGCRVEPVVPHPAPPQTRTCAMHASGSSRRAAATLVHSPGVLWAGLVRSRALPWRLARGCSARRRLPSRGSLGPHCPTFLGTLRRDDRPLSVSGDFAGRASPRYLACCQSSWSPQRDSGRGGSPRSRQGLWSPDPPSRDCGQGDRWLSHVPAFPLWLHAPLSDPAGGLDPRHNAPRTAAYRPLDSVGFPLHTPLRDILVSTTRRMAGLHHTACILAPPGSVRPLTGRHAGALLTGWLGVRQGGLQP